MHSVLWHRVRKSSSSLGNPLSNRLMMNNTEFSSKGCSRCGHLQRNHCTTAVDYFWGSLCELQELHFHRTHSQEVSLGLRWLWCCSTVISIVKRLSRSCCCLERVGVGQRTCSGPHIRAHPAPGSLGSPGCSLWEQTGETQGLLVCPHRLLKPLTALGFHSTGDVSRVWVGCPSAFRSLHAWPFAPLNSFVNPASSEHTLPSFGCLSDFSLHEDPFLCGKWPVDVFWSIRKLRVQDFLICKQHQDVTIAYTRYFKPFLYISFLIWQCKGKAGIWRRLHSLLGPEMQCLCYSKHLWVRSVVSATPGTVHQHFPAKISSRVVCNNIWESGNEKVPSALCSVNWTKPE